MSSNGIHFGAYGPFSVGQRGLQVSASDLHELWSRAEKEHPGLPKAIGVYVATIRKGKSKNFSPIYIGKTDASFKHRLKENHDLFLAAHEAYSTRRIRFFFLARLESEEGPFKPGRAKSKVILSDENSQAARSQRKPQRLKSIRTLEFLLIGECVRQGSRLLNLQEKKFHEGFNVAGGLYGRTSAGDPKSAAEIRRLFGRSNQDEDGK